jgi:D-alanyl-D-alanine dipeptidase
MKNIKTNWFYALGVVLIYAQSCSAQKSNTIPKNEFGLQVITNTNTYKSTIAADSTKKMVSLQDYIIPLITDWKYATTDNFTKTILYKKPQAYLRVEAAQALQKVQQELKQQGLSLKIFDAYRPYSVTKKMWLVVPDEKYAANPAKGSGHNRGAAVDVTIVDFKTGNELPMPTPFDDFTEKAHHNYMHLDSAVLSNRKLLRTTMEKHGFLALETEWWHYYLPNAAQRFELLDLDFKQMKKLIK